MKRRERQRIGFEDMPADLRELPLDAPPALKRQQADWLEQAGLSFVDLCGWRRSRDPLAKLRPPSRRKWLTPEQLREIDEQLEREPPRW